MTRLSDHERAHGGTVTLSAEQFEKIVELLTPGYVLAKSYLDQQQKQTFADLPETKQGDSGDETKKTES